MAHDDEFELPTQVEVQVDLQGIFRGAVRLALETVLEEQVREMVGARRWERLTREQRKDHRNGTYLRRLLTSLGWIDVTIPRTREQGSPVGVIGRYRRRSREVGGRPGNGLGVRAGCIDPGWVA